MDDQHTKITGTGVVDESANKEAEKVEGDAPAVAPDTHDADAAEEKEVA